MCRWNIQELGKVSSIHNGSTPSTSVEEFWNGNIIWITPKDLSEQNRKYIEKGERYITKKGLSKVKSKLLPKGTLLLSSRAPIGLLSIAKNELVTNQGFKNIIVDENQISNEFLYYYLKLKVKELNNLGTGTTFKELSKSSLEKFKVKLPDLPTQQKIASVLSALDDKIELNNRINAELEAMAKTLYDYWFVQFDFPIVTSSGVEKPYKTSGGKMVYNETLKREIPEGWEVKTVGDFAKIKKGTLITERTANINGNVKVVSAGVDFSYYHSESNFSNNTITISASGANAGYINFWREPIFACDCTTVRGNNDFETFYILQLLKSIQEFIFSQARGSAQPHVYPKDIESLKIIIPNEEILHKYGEIVYSMNEKITNNLKQNQELSALRDWLLPMLMNGQVKVGMLD